ncbi:sporulation integral membrane protein YlbJ [Caldalkalibacillus mannanilyticus]|uniref:sporulation integral membrane protein YlbJ n=1 Tax=Caldalkalibacillus mannanilyticus TaxID=1418 RepID=UPI0004699DB0|nr:sporulation integral membrane protein YlbJ [Caldalkalibacillus mannanilyticus]
MKQLSYLKTGFLALLSLFLVSSIISFPKQAFESSLRGLSIWWEVVFPALLPFFITAELLIGFGVVHFIGVLFEPWMRPLFRVPGVGGFVLSMGIASGYPMGAKLTVRLREQNVITRSEAERLVSITSTSGPLFMFGAVAVGFFHDVTLGIIIAGAHYIAAFQLGLIMRFHDYQDKSNSSDEENRPAKPLLYRALKAMHHARLEDQRSFGTIMGDAVTSSIQTLLLIGGFIIMFSVIINLMNIVGISQILSLFFSFILVMFGLSIELSHSLVSGFFEITLGVQKASDLAGSIPLIQKVAIASVIIAWSGLSVHAQVLSMFAHTDIRYKPFFISRILHALLAGVWTYLLWQPFQFFINNREVAVFFHSFTQERIVHGNSLPFFLYSSLVAGVITLGILLIIGWAKRVSSKSF